MISAVGSWSTLGIVSTTCDPNTYFTETGLTKHFLVIFGKDPIFCPNAKQCYCKLLGLCDLACEEEGVCRSRYTLPKYSVLPQGWPEIDWDGNERNVTELRLKLEEQHDSIQGRNERSQ